MRRCGFHQRADDAADAVSGRVNCGADGGGGGGVSEAEGSPFEILPWGGD